MKNVYRHWESSVIIVSDRFTVYLCLLRWFLQDSESKAETDNCLSHTIGSTEIVNQHIINHLQPFINHHQGDWADLLSLIYWFCCCSIIIQDYICFSNSLLIVAMNHVHHLIEDQSTDNFLGVSRLIVNGPKRTSRRWKRSESPSESQLSMYSRKKGSCRQSLVGDQLSDWEQCLAVSEELQSWLFR